MCVGHRLRGVIRQGMVRAFVRRGGLGEGYFLSRHSPSRRSCRMPLSLSEPIVAGEGGVWTARCPVCADPRLLESVCVVGGSRSRSRSRSCSGELDPRCARSERISRGAPAPCEESAERSRLSCPSSGMEICSGARPDITPPLPSLVLFALLIPGSSGQPSSVPLSFCRCSA